MDGRRSVRGGRFKGVAFGTLGCGGVSGNAFRSRQAPGAGRLVIPDPGACVPFAAIFELTHSLAHAALALSLELE